MTVGRPTSKRKVAVVTGASSATGAAICERLATEGVTVVGTFFTNRVAAESLKEALSPVVPCEVMKVDVTNEAEVEDLFTTTERLFGRLDYLVTVASFSDPTLWNVEPIAIPAELWERALATDLTGTVRCLQKAIPLMIRTSRAGAIVTFSSAGALDGDPDTVAYNAAKVGVVSFSQSVARKYGRSVRCNVIAPGSLDTGWIETWNLTAEEIHGLNALTHGVGHIGTAEDAAELTWFLLSDEARYINGQVIRLDGGSTL